MGIGVFEIIDTDLAGRIGRLHLRGGKMETPAFFPVVDPLRQEVPLSEIERAGFVQIITNAYLAYRRYGLNPPSDIRGLLGWDKVVMTDSGAYQILEYGGISVTQDVILHYQKSVLRPDIGVILDVPTGAVSRAEAEATVDETIRRAQDALRIIDPREDDILWVLPIQGGSYLDLLERSAKWASRSPYRMYGIGSPTVFMEKYRYDIIIKMIIVAKRFLPPGRPLHLFGAGHPLIIPFAVALGVDTFDSASYILYARDGRYMTEYGVYRLDELDYFPCSCPICSKYTPQDLKEMPMPERVKLLAIHNLYVISKTIKRVKQAIREGRLWELLEETARRHPAAHKALLTLRHGYSYLLTHSPRYKPRVKGLRLYSSESLWNPKIMLYKKRLYSSFLPKLLERLARDGVKEILARPFPSNIDECTKTKNLRDNRYNRYYIYYKPYIGLVPEDLCGVYPTTHSDYSSVNSSVLKVLASEIYLLVALTRRKEMRVEIEVPRNLGRLCILLRNLRGENLQVRCE